MRTMLRLGTLGVLVVGLVLEAGTADAIPGDGSATPAIGTPTRALTVAARRRRYVRPKKKAAKAAKPAPAPAETPTEAAPAPAPAAGPAAAAPSPDNLQRGGRVEFDGRLVQGQTAKSGAIYLFARQRTDLRSMVRERETYRREILRTVFTDSSK